MAVTYHAGRRIQGLSTDVATINRGTITTDGSYTVIKFTENGKFTPTSSFNVEYLVVGGGGAGGAGANNSGAGAGGGAGGYRTATGHAVTAQDYNIIVGTGGTGRSTYGQGENGGDSTFDNITSIGGGGGGYLTAGGTGGSGGGSGNNGTAGASGTAGQGNSGGAGEYRSGGGGGGAGGAGSASSGSTGGDGGSGTVSSITGSNVTYSAGGAGAGDVTGGTGGSNNTGGRGVPNGTASAGNGVVNTGSGGGGTYVTTSHPSGSGADGVVILRFLTSGNTYDISSGKPTNVQAGSRFEETDTRKMYNYTDPLTFEDDFSSDNFNDTGTKIGVANNTLEWDGAQNGSVNGSTIDLTSIDTKAIFRAKLRINTLTAPSSASSFILIGFSDSDHATAGDSNQDGIGLIIQNDADVANSFRAMHVDGAPFTPNAGTVFATVPSTATDYFIEVVLDVNTWYVRIYSDSSYSTLTEEETGSMTATGLRYFGIKMRSSASVGGTFDGYIDDLKIYNGVTSTSNYWQEIGA